MMGEMWSQAGSVMASAMFLYAIFQQYFPPEIRRYFDKYSQKLIAFFYPYIQITFHEYSGDGFERSNAYSSIERYLAANSSNKAKRLKADMVQDCKSLVLSMDDHEEITDEYQGVKLWWGSSKILPNRQSISFYPREDDKRYYKLTFHRQHRDLVTGTYLSHVLDKGKAIAVESRQRKLYTNNKNESWYGKKSMWSHVVFEHPATFDTWALEPSKKDEIIKDLIRFSKSKDYYKKVGKAWKRGYLLYGPPGTGKSTMIAAMANLLHYDVYDLELTSVKDNTELRKLLIDTSSKSIIVIEDIDCSLDLTGQRKPKKKDDEKEDPNLKAAKAAENVGGKDDNSKVTLSGLLNFIDGLWSACGGERIIVFTTNYIEKLDPALIRRGRMDKHIELSYCCFEAFKVLARNYLDIENHHELFEPIKKLLGEVNMTPADVAENLMPKCDEEQAESCLKSLIGALKTAKEEAKKKAEDEEKARLKAEEEEKARLKAEEEEKAKEKNVEEKKDDEMVGKDVKENGVVAKEVNENGVVAKEVKENGDVVKK